jgi:hypothetical protein
MNYKYLSPAGAERGRCSNLSFATRRSEENLLEASKQARLRAWAVLQRLRALLCDLGNVTIDPLSKKTFDTEGAILEHALTKRVRDHSVALEDWRLSPEESTKQHSVIEVTLDRPTRHCSKRSTGLVIS